MRALFLVDSYFPSTRSSARLIHDLACATRDLGHEAIVVAPVDTGQPATVTDEDGLTVMRVRTGKTKGASWPVRAFNETRLSADLWRAGRTFFEKNPCDIVAFYSPTIFFGELVARLKHMWGCRSFLILRDIFPQWAVDTGMLRAGGLPHRYFRRKELEQYRAADVIAVQSPANLAYFEGQPWARDFHLDVLYNWMNIEVPVPKTDFRRQLLIGNRVVFFFGGNVGIAQVPDRVADLAGYLRGDARAFVLLVGQGSEKDRIAARVRDEKLDNMAVLDSVDQTTYLGLLDEVDVGLITLDRRLATQNFPGKMLGYFHRSKPILATINPGNDLQRLLEEHDAGIVCTEPDNHAFFEAATRLLTDGDLRRRMGANGRRVLEAKLSAESAARKFIAHARPARGPRSTVVLVNQYYAPSEAATARLLADVGRALSEDGHRVHAICDRREYNDPTRRYPVREKLDGVEVRRVRSTGFGRRAGLGRVLDFATFLAGAFVRLLFGPRPDVVIALTTPPLLASWAHLAARLRGARFIYWVMDVYPDLAFRLGVLRRESIAGRLLAAIGAHTLRRSEHVIALGETMAERLNQHGARNVSVIHNWADGEAIRPRPVEDHPLRRDWGWEDIFVVLYSGNLGLAQEFDTVLDAAGILRDDTRIRFAIVGDGPRREQVERGIRERKLDNVELRPYVDEAELGLGLTSGDLHLITLRNDMAGLLVPSKIYGILAAGRPVLYVGPAECEIAAIVEQAGNGGRVAVGDAESLAARIRQYARDPQSLADDGDRARRAFDERFTRDHALAAFRRLVG